MYSSDFRRMGRESLQGNWGAAIGGTFVLGLIEATMSGTGSVPLIGLFFYIAYLIIAGPIWIGSNYYFNRLLRGEMPVFEDFFKGFGLFGRSAAVFLLMTLKLLCWSLLLIIPGIIKSFAYTLTPYISLDYPDLTASQCIKLSNEMMKGYKWRLFCLYFSFIGWAIACIFTLGIGYLWLFPYTYASRAAFYQYVKNNYEGNSTQEIQQEYITV